MCVKSLQSCLSLQFYGQLPARLLCPWDSPGTNAGVDCQVLLQGIFPTGVKPVSLMSPALAGGFSTASATWEALKCIQGHSHGLSAAFAWWLLFSRAVSQGLKILPLSQTFHHDLRTSKGRRQRGENERTFFSFSLGGEYFLKPPTPSLNLLPYSWVTPDH